MRKKVEDKIIIAVKQEDLEESISGLSSLLPILLKNVAIGNKGNIRQTKIDQEELSRHFKTAIDAMTMIYAAHIEESDLKAEIFDVLEELGHYREIGSVEEFEQLKKKNTPSKIEARGRMWVKCQCGAVIRPNKYCPYCGQRLEVEFCTE